jgi:hypothetical protein
MTWRGCARDDACPALHLGQRSDDRPRDPHIFLDGATANADAADDGAAQPQRQASAEQHDPSGLDVLDAVQRCTRLCEAANLVGRHPKTGRRLCLGDRQIAARRQRVVHAGQVQQPGLAVDNRNRDRYADGRGLGLGQIAEQPRQRERERSARQRATSPFAPCAPARAIDCATISSSTASTSRLHATANRKSLRRLK